MFSSPFLSFVLPSLSLPPPRHNSRPLRQRDGGVGPATCLNRILLHPSELGHPPKLPHFPPNDPRYLHIRDVLRLPSTGASIRAGIINQALVDDVPVMHSANGADLDINSGTWRPMPEPPAVTLVLAVPRPKVLARLMPQIAAVGVRDIILVNAYKVERCYFDARLLRDDAEMKALLIDGVSQSAVDCRLPTVTVEKRLKVFLEDRLEEITSSNTVKLVAEPGSERTMSETLTSSAALRTSRGEIRTSAEGLQNGSGKPGSLHVVVAVGPEGGWMPRELEMLERFGFCRVGIGERVLRTDAAVLVLLGLVHEVLRNVARKETAVPVSD